jgi:hypothetical protein
MKITIAKLHKYPAEVPTETAVGFNVTFDNDRSIYIDTVVGLDLTEEEAVAAAWEKVKGSVQSQKLTIGALPKLLGSVFNPPVEEVAEAPIVEDLETPVV